MNSNTNKLLYQIALTKINGIGDMLARVLLNEIDDVETIFRSSNKDLMAIPNITTHLVSEILDPEVLRKAEKELRFVEKNNITTYFINDANYPHRLKECADSPILLYYKGNADLNAQKIVSIVGTRKSTSYGNEFCDRFVSEIASSYPDVLIVSGLAYGVDIQSHRAALKSNLPTIGVMAHGLDRIYPLDHRKTAVEMLDNGGLLTEFTSETEPERFNFVRRNRIVAGMADAVVVVQSDTKGGSLITADLANSYNVDVFAVPGRVTDHNSSGCNALIADNKAILLQSTDSFVRHLQWDVQAKMKKQPKQQSLFLDLTPEEQSIYDLLLTTESMHINQMASILGIPISTLMSILFTMEMSGIVKAALGGLYMLANQ